MGIEIDGLTWRINRTYRASYVYDDKDTYPLNLSISPALPDVMILVTNATTMGPNQNNITSTINVPMQYDLAETLIECISSNTIRTSIMIAGSRGNYYMAVEVTVFYDRRTLKSTLKTGCSYGNAS